MTNNLHILTKHEIHAPVLASDNTHALLLLREAVYLLLQPLPLGLQNKKVYVMAEDLLARGVPATKLSANIELIDYAKFVDLTMTYTTSTSW